jgi:hypothetical protein
MPPITPVVKGGISMRRFWILSSFVISAVSFAAAIVVSAAAKVDDAPKSGPAKTLLVRTGTNWTLARDNKPYFILGAGGGASKKQLAETGANSYRTWGPPGNKELDEAQGLGLTVAVGIGIAGDNGTFYNTNSAGVARQLEDCKGIINRLKEHPAVLLWGIGNEMEGPGKPGDNPFLWKAIDDIAAAAKEIDPNHPTMTVVADVSPVKVRAIHQFCPHLDIVGINTYGAAALNVGARYRAAGGTKPYIVTEYGPPGAWEQTRGAAAIATKPGGPPPYIPLAELSSGDKAAYYRDGWRAGIASNRGFCLGGYAFTWGAKWEATATWYGMLLADGAKVEAVDVMTEIWSGKPPANKCPRITNLQVVGGPPVGVGRLYAPGATIGAKVQATDPENDTLTCKWSLNIDAEGNHKDFPGAIKRTEGGSVEIELPKDPGNYRLYAYVYDGKGGAATASVTVHVIAPR